MLTRDEVLMGRDVEYPLNQELEDNLINLLEAINRLYALTGIEFTVSSGYRPGRYNKAARGAKDSSHMTCQAVDLHDVNGRIKKAVTVNLLEQCGLYMEDPRSTPTWCHLQVRPTVSRIFKP